MWPCHHCHFCVILEIPFNSGFEFKGTKWYIEATNSQLSEPLSHIKSFRLWTLPSGRAHTGSFFPAIN